VSSRKESHTNIAKRGRPYVTPKKQYKSFSAGWLGRGISPPHYRNGDSPLPLTPSESRFSAPSAFQSRRPCLLIFRCIANGKKRQNTSVAKLSPKYRMTVPTKCITTGRIGFAEQHNHSKLIDSRPSDKTAVDHSTLVHQQLAMIRNISGSQV